MIEKTVEIAVNDIVREVLRNGNIGTMEAVQMVLSQAIVDIGNARLSNMAFIAPRLNQRPLL